ncbi:MAG: hypothetical protein ACN6OP_10950 [Pseudomonadales bacterium]
MSVRKIIIWNEQETTSVVVRAYEISLRARMNLVNLFLQAQREVLRLDRQRKLASAANFGEYVTALWRELLSFPEDKARAYVDAWNAKRITSSFEARPRGMHAKNAMPHELPKFGWDWKEPGTEPLKVKGPAEFNTPVDHDELHRQAQAALAAEAQDSAVSESDEADTWRAETPTPQRTPMESKGTWAFPGKRPEQEPENIGEAIVGVISEGLGRAPYRKTVKATSPDEARAITSGDLGCVSVAAVLPSSSFAIDDKVRSKFVGALTDYVRYLLHADLETAVRQVAHEMGETLVRPIVKPIIAGMVQEEVLPLVNETVSVGLNNALASMGQSLRDEMDSLTKPGSSMTAAPASPAEAQDEEEDTSILHYVIIFGLQADEFMRAVSVVMPYSKHRLQVVHAKDLRQVQHHLRDDTKLIHMIKMSAHLTSEIKERVARTYPVNGGVSEAKKVLLDIVNGTNLMPSY